MIRCHLSWYRLLAFCQVRGDHDLRFALLVACIQNGLL